MNGYSFACEGEKVRVLNLNDVTKAAVLSKTGEVLETSMDDIGGYKLNITHTEQVLQFLAYLPGTV